MNELHEKYRAYRAKVQLLLGDVDEARGLFEELEMSAWAETARAMAARLDRDAFKVLVIGEFKRGKSTFINALLKEEVLPAFSTPCTAVINEIRYGDTKEAVLVFREDSVVADGRGLPEEVREHLRGHVGSAVPPLKVSVDDLEEYVVIPDPAEDQAKSVASSPYERVEIQWPLELCRNGVELIDSPGLNEHGTRTKVTTDYLSQADAIVFVMSCQALASQSELNVVDNQIRAGGHVDIFFVANRFDEIRERERGRLVDYAHRKLADRTELGRDGVFFVSALDALDGYLDEDPSRVARSGMVTLEERLSSFLTEERGRVKLMQPTGQLLKGIATATNDIIPGKRAMLRQGASVLRARYEDVKPDLQDADRRRQQIIDKMNNHRKRLRRDVELMLKQRQAGVASSLSGWLQDCSLEEEMSFLTLKPKERVKVVVQEVVEALRSRIESEQLRWQEDALQPEIERHLEEMTDDVSDKLRQLLDKLDEVMGTLTGAEPCLAKDQKEISAIERVLAAAGGFFVGGVGAAFVGGSMGFGEMVKSLGPHILVTLGMLLVGWSNPFILIPVLLGGGVVQGIWKQDKHTGKVREKVVEAMESELRERAHEAAVQGALIVYDKTENIVVEIDRGLQKEIAGIREQVESALRELKQGESQVEQRLGELDVTSRKLGALDNRLRGELMDLATMRAG